MRKLLLVLVLLLFAISCGKKETKTLKIAAASFPMDEIVKIAAEDLEKKGYNVELTVLTDYVTANVGLNAKDFDANFHQHEPFMKIFNSKNEGTLVKIGSIYDVYVGFYSKNYTSKDDIVEEAKVGIPSDPTNMDRALKILAKENLIKLNEKDGLVNLDDIVENYKNLQIMPVKIPTLVQAYQEMDLVFNWPAHMIKIGKTPKDALFLEGDENGKYAISLVAREDNKDSKEIKALYKAMTSEKVKAFLQEKYGVEGFPMF